MLMRPDGRLTQQGRLMRTFLFLTLLVGAVVVGSQAVATAAGTPPLADTHTVVSGETLWSIAQSVAAPGESTTDVIDEIIALNGMGTARVYAGDQILVPIAP